MKQRLIIFIVVYMACSITFAGQMASDRISDIRNTKHNFSANDVVSLPNSGTRDVKAASEDEVCVFCHTPHGAPNLQPGERAFLWNRALSSATYTRYDSSSFDASVKNAVLGRGSKMCLSCHDGTVAIGQLDVLNGRLKENRAGDAVMVGANVNAGLLTGRRNLGLDLSNDHPVAIIYDSILAAADGELIDPASPEGAHIGVPVGRGIAQNNNIIKLAGGTPVAGQPIETTGRGLAVPLESEISLLGKKSDSEALALVSASERGSIECTTCHDPHIRSSDNSENIKFLRLHRFQKAAVSGGSFSIDGDINCLACHKKEGWAASVHANDVTATQSYQNDAADVREFPQGIQMWQASCLNCHDTHTDTGARWLLRQATDGSDNSEIENTCFQCHSGSSVLDDGAAKDIETANLLGGEHTASDFNSNTDLHNIINANFQESQANLQSNRHVTCSDCHNPHRIVKNTLADASGNANSALHVHESSVIHNNLLSGALSGSSGVEPSFSVGDFNPHSTVSGITYTEKFGAVDELTFGAADVDELAVVSREYQICLKCHSNWGLDETGTVGLGIGADPKKPNTAEEFGPNAASYHPVIKPTNLILDASKIHGETDTENFLPPFNLGVGTQTMYCSDCHNSNVSGTQGPHGSTGLLKTTGANVCADCHDPAQYQRFGTANVQDSGFSCAVGNNVGCITPSSDDNANNLHVFHAGPKGTGADNVCTDCHVKIPHGWRNKALLADRDEPDIEGLKARYYPDAKQNIVTYDTSGAWKHDSCGSGANGCHAN